MVNAEILIVEDESIIAKDIQDMLESLGYSVLDVVSTGEEAVEKVAEIRPDLVLMDIVLEGQMNGLEAAEQIRDRFGIPVVYITAYADDKTLQRAKVTEPYGYILKPFDERELHTAIEMALYKCKMERKLKESEQWLATTLKSIGDGVIATDARGFVIFMNAVAEALTGWRQEDAAGKPLKDVFNIINEETGQQAEDPTTKVLREGLVIGLANHTVLIAKDGTERPIDDSGAPIRDDEGNMTGVVLVFRDIAERRQAEKKLHNSEERFRSLVETTSDWIWEVDANGRYTYVSPKVKDLLGYEPQEVIGKTPFDFMDPEEAKRVLSEFNAVKEAKKPFYGMENINLCMDGREVVLETSGVPILDDDGVLRGYRGIDRDITRRRQAEKTLAMEKERLSVTLRSIADGVIATDTEGRIVLINSVAEELTGWAQEEATGKPIAEVFHIINEYSRERCENPFEKVIEGDDIVGLSNYTVLIARDGTERIIADSGASMRDKDGNIIGVVLVFRDITTKRKMEEELLKVHRLESLGILAGGIAHDFNNILMAILGKIGLSKMCAKPGDKLFERLTAAENATLRAKDLTHQLLTFSKGGVPIKKTAFVSDLLKDAAVFALSGTNVRGDFSIAGDLWPVEVDRGQISQVINNLVINASQAMPEGGIIKVSAENTTVGAQEAVPVKEGKYVKICIEDQGIGIPKKHLQQIFDPYFTTKQKGSGLGLATAYSVVKRHDGHIEVESEVGVGSTFNIYLPASSKEVLIEKELREIIRGHGKVLVMDDEKAVREVVGEILETLGYEVEFAKDGAEASELYEKAKKSAQPFDVAILDLTVPGGMGGKETVQKLIKIDPEVKAIASSGYSIDPVMANFRKYGFMGIVAKPYRIKELSDTLCNVIEERGSLNE